MPLGFEIDQELNALVIRVDEVVDATDFVNSLNQIPNVPGFKTGMNQLVDFRAGGLALLENSSRELVNFFESSSVREKLGSNYQLAFVAARPVDFGQLRMYEAHAVEGMAPYGVAIRIFYSLMEARQWLGESPEN